MPDVNLLVYAHRRDEATHEAYRDWFMELVNDDEPFALSILVAVGFVRVVTNPRIFTEPTPLPLALAVVDDVTARTSCRLVRPGTRHWSLVRDACSATGATGKLVADAQHAAMAVEHGCEWVTRDSDFERFTGWGLRWRLLAFGDSP